MNLSDSLSQGCGGVELLSGIRSVGMWRTMASAEGKEPAVLDIASLDIYTLIGIFIGILTEQAWRHMGLRMDPKTQEAKKDFERAAIAIDCIEFMTSKLEKEVSEDEAKRLKALVADLQINFAREKAA